MNSIGLDHTFDINSCECDIQKKKCFLQFQFNLNYFVIHGFFQPKITKKKKKKRILFFNLTTSIDQFTIADENRKKKLEFDDNLMERKQSKSCEYPVKTPCEEDPYM